MNSNVLYLSLIGFLSLAAGAASRYIPQEESERELSRSKRSQTADHSIQNKLSRNRARNLYLLSLRKLVDSLDTSGQLVATTPDASVAPPTTTTTRVRSHPTTSRGGEKRRKGKGKKGRKMKKGGKRRGGRRGRKSRRRRNRAIAEDIVHLLDSDQGEEILQAIANVIDGDYQYANDVEELENFVKHSAKKCKCSKKRKSKD